MNLKNAALSSLLLIVSVTAQTTDTLQDHLVVGNIGKGTLAIIIFAIFGMVLCFFREASYFPNLVVCFGFCLPITVFLIILALPKRDGTTTTTAAKE